MLHVNLIPVGKPDILEGSSVPLLVTPSGLIITSTGLKSYDESEIFLRPQEGRTWRKVALRQLVQNVFGNVQ